MIRPRVMSSILIPFLFISVAIGMTDPNKAPRKEQKSCCQTQVKSELTSDSKATEDCKTDKLSCDRKDMTADDGANLMSCCAGKTQNDAQTMGPMKKDKTSQTKTTSPQR